MAIDLVGFILSNFSTFIFLKTHPAMAILEGVLRVSGNILLAATIAISIVELLRPKEEAKPRRKRVVAAIGLMLVAIGLSFMNFKASSEFKKFGDVQDVVFVLSLFGKTKREATRVNATQLYD